MEHVVFYPGLDGSPAFRRFGSLDEAVRYVEHLRNAEGVSEFSVHALSPVPLAFRAYYRVEVPAETAAPVADPADIDEPVGDTAPAETAPADAPLVDVGVGSLVPEPAVNGKRSLGFFAH
jgi:hypothetical protein